MEKLTEWIILSFFFQNLNEDDIKKEVLVLQEERHHYEMRAKVHILNWVLLVLASQVFFHLVPNTGLKKSKCSQMLLAQGKSLFSIYLFSWQRIAWAFAHWTSEKKKVTCSRQLDGTVFKLCNSFTDVDNQGICFLERIALVAVCSWI